MRSERYAVQLFSDTCLYPSIFIFIFSTFTHHGLTALFPHPLTYKKKPGGMWQAGGLGKGREEAKNPVSRISYNIYGKD